MSKLIQLSKAIKALTTDKILRRKIHDDYSYAAKKHGLIRNRNKTENYVVDEKEFYSWVRDNFNKLKPNIPEAYRYTQYIANLVIDSALNANAPIPSFCTLEEAKDIIQGLVNENRDQVYALKARIKELEEDLDNAKEKVDKWDNFIEKKRGKRHL
jgi:hypothetical protein